MGILLQGVAQPKGASRQDINASIMLIIIVHLLYNNPLTSLGKVRGVPLLIDDNDRFGVLGLNASATTRVILRR